MNAGFRETTWTTLEGCDGLESPVQYEQIQEDWYLYQDSESVPVTIEQVRHEVPAEFTTLHLESGRATADVATADVATKQQCVSQRTEPIVSYYESESDDKSGLKPVAIEYIP